jgi:hypothetical protein
MAISEDDILHEKSPDAAATKRIEIQLTPLPAYFPEKLQGLMPIM